LACLIWAAYSRLARLTKDYRDCLLEVSGAVTLLKAYIKELIKARGEDIERLMQDAVGDAVNAWCLVRSCFAHCFLDLRCGDVRAFDWWRVLESVDVREVGLE
jgi:hypothetical protein